MRVPTMISEATKIKIADYVVGEWHRVPMMPSQEMFDAAWRRIIERANDKFGADAVGLASSEIELRMNNIGKK